MNFWKIDNPLNLTFTNINHSTDSLFLVLHQKGGGDNMADIEVLNRFGVMSLTQRTLATYISLWRINSMWCNIIPVNIFGSIYVKFKIKISEHITLLLYYVTDSKSTIFFFQLNK